MTELSKSRAVKAPEQPITVSLTAGLNFPNWSAVRSETARQALTEILQVTGAERKWSGLDEMEDCVRRSVLMLYAELGRPPQVSQLAEATGIPREAVTSQLRKLNARDMVVLDGEDGRVTGAYPFSERETGHRVRLAGKVVNAMCAIDALGVGSMYGSDADIDSSCLRCGTPIRVAVRDKGHSLETVSPATAVVWSGIYYEDCAATSLCTVLTFFCCDDHLEAWRKQNPRAKGYRLTMDEGFQVGRAIFMNLLG